VATLQFLAKAFTDIDTGMRDLGYLLFGGRETGMELSEEQKKAVASWAADGLGLSDIQKRLRNDFGVCMTYMDVRFLVLELGAELKDKPETRNVAVDAVAGVSGPATQPAAGTAGATALGGVSVDVDVVTKPGAIVSGTVTFGDGVKATWFLDQLGRLALDAVQPGYKPSEQDLAGFQQELRTVLQKRGF